MRARNQCQRMQIQRILFIASLLICHHNDTMFRPFHFNIFRFYFTSSSKTIFEFFFFYSSFFFLLFLIETICFLYILCSFALIGFSRVYTFFLNSCLLYIFHLLAAVCFVSVANESVKFLTNYRFERMLRTHYYTMEKKVDQLDHTEQYNL